MHLHSGTGTDPAAKKLSGPFATVSEIFYANGNKKKLVSQKKKTGFFYDRNNLRNFFSYEGGISRVSLSSGPERCPFRTAPD